MFNKGVKNRDAALSALYFQFAILRRVGFTFKPTWENPGLNKVSGRIMNWEFTFRERSFQEPDENRNYSHRSTRFNKIGYN